MVVYVVIFLSIYKGAFPIATLAGIIYSAFAPLPASPFISLKTLLFSPIEASLLSINLILVRHTPNLLLYPVLSELRPLAIIYTVPVPDVRRAAHVRRENHWGRAVAIMIDFWLAIDEVTEPAVVEWD